MEHGENGEPPEPHDKNEDTEHNLNGTPEGRLDEEVIENAVPDIEFPENGDQPESTEETEKEPHPDGGREGEPEDSERNMENLSEEDIENAVPDVEFPENENLPLEESEGEPFSDTVGRSEGEPEVSEEDIENAVPDIEFPENGDQPEVSEDMEGEIHSDEEHEGNQSEPSEGMEGEKRSDGEREGELEEGKENIENSVPGGEFIEIGGHGPPEDPEENPSLGVELRSDGGHIHNTVTTIGSRWEGKSIRDGLGKEEYKGESRHVREIKEREEDVRKLLENMQRDLVEKDVRKEIENKLRENLRESGFGKKEIDKIVEKMIKETVEERLNELLGRTTSSEIRSGSGSYGDNSFLNAFSGALNFLVEGVLSVFGKVFSSVAKLGKTHSSQSGSRSQDSGEQKFQGWSSEKQGTFKAERQGGELRRLHATERRAEKVEIKKPVEKGARVEPHREERHNVEKTFKPGVEARFSGRTGLMKTPEGGWKQYVTDSTRVQGESTPTSFEKTRTISQGETPEGVRVKEITGNAEAHNVPVRIPIDGKQFENFWFNIRSLEHFSRMETERPVEVSLRKELKGDNIKSEVWFHSDSRLKDLREMGMIRERWRDVNGVEYARISRWLVFSLKVEGRNVAIGCLDVKEVGAGREGIDRSPDFKWFNPQPREPLEGKSGGESKTSIKGSSETGGKTQWMERFFREDNTQKYDYRAKLDITELRYLPSGEAGSAAKAAETSSVAETFEKLFEQRAVEALGKTEAALEKNAGTSSMAETSKEVGEKSAYDNIEKNASASNIIGTPEAPAEKKFESSNSSGMVKTSDWADWGKRFISVDFGEGVGVKGVPVEGVMKAFADRVFGAGGENEYYEKLRESGIWLDGEKLSEMLFVKHEIPVEVYGALVPLEENTYKKISDAEPHLETKSEEDYWRVRMREAGLEPLAEREKQLEQFDKVAVMEKHIQETTESPNEPKTEQIYAMGISGSEKSHTDATKSKKKKKKTGEKEESVIDDSRLKGLDGELSDENIEFETLEEEKKWLDTLDYKKQTVLILGTVFSFSLFSKPVLSKVIEAKNKSKSEGNDGILLVCREAIKHFQEEEYIDVAGLLTITRYLKKTSGRTSQPSEVETATEAGPVLDDYRLELKNIEELLQLLDAEYIKTPDGLSVPEPLEPYVKINVPKNKLEKMRQRVRKTVGKVSKLNKELRKLGASVKYENLYMYLRRTKMPLDIYLKVCHILGIKVNLKKFTRWRSLTVDIAAGMWYNHKNVMVLIHLDDLKKLYDDLIKELESRGIGLDKFVATQLRGSGSMIHDADQLMEIPHKGFIDTITLKEICKFLGRNPSELRELDQESMSKKERVHLPRKVVHMLRLKIWKKYGFRYLNILAEKVKVNFNNLDQKAKESYKSYLRACLNGENRIPLELLEKIESILDVKIKDSLHIRMRVRQKEDFTREVIREGEDKNILIEKIEVNELDMGKRTLLTFIHRREEGGELTTEIKEIGKTLPSTLILWFLNPPNTEVTVNRTREFKNREDLLTYIIKKCAKRAGSKRRAAKILGVSHSTIDLLLVDKKHDTVILKNLLTFVMYSGVKLSTLTDYIEQVGVLDRRTNPRLVIDLNNPEGAHIVMNMYGDGTFVKYGTKYTIKYENKQIDFVKTFVEKIRKVYGITLSINEDRGYPLVSTHSPQIGHSLEMAGLTPGHKARINKGVPKWVIEGTVEMLKDATDAYLADEAHITQEIRIDSDVEEPQLKKYRDILKQIKGIKLKNPQGKVLGKRISIGKLGDYEEIFNIAKNKQSKLLEGVRQVIINLLTKRSVSLKENDTQLETVHINVYLNGRITVTKRLRIKSEVTEKLHEIQGGFPGYKELMYANHMSIGNVAKRFPLRLDEDEIEILKSIGKERGDTYLVSVKKLPQDLKKRYANPPQEVLDWQREYFEKEVEILVDGRPVKVRGMPSRLKGEIIISPNENIISWKLVPALSEEIKKKWEEIKPLLKMRTEGDKNGA